MTSPDRTPGLRVLVTGSREIRDSDAPAIKAALLEAVGDVPGRHTLTHCGAAGADRLAAGLAHGWGWLVHKRCALWSAACLPECDHDGRKPNRYGKGTMCPAQGVYRNSRMVREGHDVAVAVFAKWARNAGTADCTRRAREAGIPVLLVHVERDGSWSMKWSPDRDQGEQLELGEVAS